MSPTVYIRNAPPPPGRLSTALVIALMLHAMLLSIAAVRQYKGLRLKDVGESSDQPNWPGA